MTATKPPTPPAVTVEDLLRRACADLRTSICRTVDTAGRHITDPNGGRIKW